MSDLSSILPTRGVRERGRDIKRPGSSIYVATIALFCPGLGLGGSERQLVNLAKGLRQRKMLVYVLTLYSGGELEQELRQAGIQIICLGKTNIASVATTFLRLIRVIRNHRIDVLYSFHGLPNLLTLLVKLVSKRMQIVLGVRSSFNNVSSKSIFHKSAFWLESKLSRRADLIIANSWAGKRFAMQRGFPGDRVHVIENGIDLERFAPNSVVRQRARHDLNIDINSPLIGMVARIDPVKDHQTFLRAAARLSGRCPDVRFICVWDGDEAEKCELARDAEELGLGGVLRWIRGTVDLVPTYNAMDVAVLSSFSEGFPNVVAEAMSCGCACVVTDAGDAPAIVGDAGVVVPCRNPDALADGMERLVRKLRDGTGEYSRLKSRNRIVGRFSNALMIDKTIRALETIVSQYA